MKPKLLVAAVAAAIAAAARQAGAQSFKPANGWVSDAALMLDAKEWQKGTERTRAALAARCAMGCGA